MTLNVISFIDSKGGNSEEIRESQRNCGGTLDEKYVAAGYLNPEILVRLKDHYNTTQYILFFSLLKKKCMQWGLKSTHGQAHTMESIGPSIKCLHLQYPQQGSHDMKAVLRDEEGVMTPRKLILRYMNEHYPNKVLAHKYYEGLDNGLYNPDDTLERRPDNIFQQSERWNFTDFLVKVHMPYLQQVWEKYACPGHKVYDLVPPAFNAQASAFFAESRYLAVTNNTA
ncbi:hypothetical protein SERLADRAFT_404783 [Serpula lacrymans var. lacrymans S7.9]|uniref:Uncharacterized protein n=1 Tax=Serpula lacrymans var. lacrymans (strain S7.9) TaxID=578457 RepID=F8ND10_SERL9|nr:uncharacterized protein SERLADRAFT_404783 [Serpula lacrymans var. lacrymans S7.9]EGO30754.1 hypothetical protein SERLADRAFT_404783 [Serpula lacrymans var. lacrymans S7.9]